MILPNNALSQICLTIFKTRNRRNVLNLNQGHHIDTFQDYYSSKLIQILYMHMVRSINKFRSTIFNSVFTWSIEICYKWKYKTKHMSVQLSKLLARNQKAFVSFKKFTRLRNIRYNLHLQKKDFIFNY